MKKFIIYSLALGNLLFSSSTAFSQAPEPVVNPNADKGQSDPKSEEILKKVAAIYKGYKTINASFTLTTTSLNKKPVVSKGNVWIKGNKFKLDYASQEIYCNGTTIWTYNPEDAEVTLEDYKKRDNSITPNEIFTVYSKGYKSKYEGPIVTDGNKVRDVIRLVPKKKANYSYLKLEIDNSNYKICKVIQHYKNGTEVSIEMVKLTPNTPLKDEFFQWSEVGHEGVEVVDLTKSSKKKKKG
jgi:outer membrane lipoprotein-sorting protein